jgi:hypothetical protein
VTDEFLTGVDTARVGEVLVKKPDQDGSWRGSGPAAWH